MSNPSPDQLRTDYLRDGYFFPISVFDADQLSSYRNELASFERASDGMQLGNKGQLNHPHLLCRFAAEIVSNEKLLDAVEALIGPDILLWGSTFFFKEPHTQSYVSWHQDMRYWGIEDPDALVSAWLALAPVNIGNGCMKFVRGSHTQKLLDHKDTYDASNILTRGQEADINIDEDSVVFAELDAGQVSMHHGYLLHASAPNNSADRRLGYTMNFIAPHNRQTVASRDFAVLLRGEDRYGYYDHVSLATEDLSDASLDLHRKVLLAQNEAMYEGAPVAAT